MVGGGFRSALGAMMLIAFALLLAACNSQSTAQDTLDPNMIAAPAATGPSEAGVPATAIPGPAAATSASPESAALVANARIQFAPIVGTSVEAAGTLSSRLLSRARERGVHTVGSDDKTTTHLLKGYFTPLVEGRETTVIYVWDVYDPAGNRVHRISGQQKSKSSGGDGWAAVPPATMQSIADATVDQLTAWLAGQNG
jgi:hypothetical protein